MLFANIPWITSRSMCWNFTVMETLEGIKYKKMTKRRVLVETDAFRSCIHLTTMEWLLLFFTHLKNLTGEYLWKILYLSWILRKLLLQSNSKEGLKKQKKTKKTWNIQVIQYSKSSIFKSLNASLNIFLSIFSRIHFYPSLYIFSHYWFTEVLKTPGKLISSSKISSFSSSEFQESSRRPNHKK